MPSEEERLSNVLRYNTYASHKKTPGLNYVDLASIVAKRGLRLPPGKHMNLKVRTSSRLSRSELIELIRGHIASGVKNIDDTRYFIEMIDLRQSSERIDELIQSWSVEEACLNWACRISDQGVTADYVKELIEGKKGTHIALGIEECKESGHAHDEACRKCQGITSFCIFSISEHDGIDNVYIWMLCAAKRVAVSGATLYKAVERYAVEQAREGRVVFMRLCSVPQAYPFWSKMGFQDIWDGHPLATTCVDTKKGPFVDGIDMMKPTAPQLQTSTLVTSPDMRVRLHSDWNRIRVTQNGVPGDTFIEIDAETVGVVIASGFYFLMYPEFLSEKDDTFKWTPLQNYEIRHSILTRRGHINPIQKELLSKVRLRFLYLPTSDKTQSVVDHDITSHSLRKYNPNREIHFKKDSLNAVVIFRTKERTKRRRRRT